MNNMDILYVHTSKKISNSEYSIMPVGIFSIVNNLLQNLYTVKGINIGIENALNKNYNFVEELRKYSYKVLLIDLHWYEHSYSAIEVAKLSKQINHNAKVILGGLTSTIYSESILKDYSCVDYIIRGDSEEPMKLLMDYIIRGIGTLENIPNIAYRDNTGIVCKEITYSCQNIDDYDFVSDDFLKNSRYYSYATTNGMDRTEPSNFWLTIGRGCIYNCKYCCGSKQNSQVLFGREGMIVRSPERIVKDISVLSSKGIKKINPTHDLQMLGKDYYKAIFDGIKKDNITIGMYLESFQIPSKEFIDDVADTFEKKNTALAISPICADEKTRHFNGKYFTNKQLMESIDYIISKNMIAHIYYSMNVFGEGDNTYSETIEQMYELIDKYPIEQLRISCQGVVLDPLAPIRKDISNTQLNTFTDYYNYCKDNIQYFVGYNIDGKEDLPSRQQKYNGFIEEVISKIKGK